MEKILSHMMSHNHYVLFALGGILTFCYELISTISLTEFFKIGVMYAYAFAIITGMILLFFYHSYITFSLPHCNQRLLRFLLVYLFGYTVGWVFLFVIMNYGIHYITAIVFVSLIQSIFNYNLSKKWVFQVS